MLYNEHDVNSMPSAGFLVRLPFWGETVFGLSGYQPFDNQLIWTVYEPLLAYNDSIADRLPTDQIKNDLDVVSFQLTAAREFIEDEMSIGIGLQVLRADLFLKNLTFRHNPMGAPISDRPRDKITELSSNDGSGWGFGVKGGFLWKPSEKLNVALTGNLPFDISIDGSTRLSYVMPKDDYMISEGNPDRYYPESVEYWFVAGDMIILQGDFETDLKLPASIGFGLAYIAGDKLTLALDAEYTLWSKFEGFEFTFSNFSGLPTALREDEEATEFFSANMTLPVDWDNTAKVMAGAHYAYNDYLSFVAGVSMDQSPMSDAQEVTPLFVDPGDKYGFNGGILLSIDRWDLGLITSYFHYPDDQTAEELVDVNDDGLADNFPGTYSAAAYETVFSINYRF
jgi:long-chain fatty acid transport protein